MNDIQLQIIRFLSHITFGETKKKYHSLYKNELSRRNELLVEKTDDTIKVSKYKKSIIISKKHEIYLPDILRLFDFYYSAVKPVKNVVDFSHPHPCKVVGYKLHRVMFPSFAEPVDTTKQYIDFAQLNEDSIVIDLGAYSGLTSIFFDMAISKKNPKAKGKVIAIDADTISIPCIEYNLGKYKKKTGRNIEFLHAAVSDKNETVEFSCEGNMGASTIDIVGGRGKVETIRAVTLSEIARLYNLDHVDFVKCDIEGGEIHVFKDKEFLKKYHPKLIVETHYLNPPNMTTEQTVSLLKDAGYSVKEVPQDGFDLPLLEAV